MFVEIVRLLIVFLFTTAGFELAKGGASAPAEGSAVLGATLGACVGYVAGGIVGRLLNRTMGAVERRVDRAPAAQLLAGALGAGVLSVPSALIGVPAVVLLPGVLGWPLLGLLVWTGMFAGFRLGVAKSEELLGMAGLSTRPLATVSRYGSGRAPETLLVDTSAVIDGRALAVADAGFLRGDLLVPRFILDELQGIADAADPTRRRRGRRGLEVLDTLQRDGRIGVHVIDDEVPELQAVDAKLVALARRLQAGVLTTDANLQRVAELQGVTCLNLNRLADGLRPVLVPGEVVRLPISREGREPGQGVGFLEDGTMVVVGEASELVGREVDVRITSNVQTSVGRMLFAAVVAAA
jgi:uncharacterized protein YacL